MYGGGWVGCVIGGYGVGDLGGRVFDNSKSIFKKTYIVLFKAGFRLFLELNLRYLQGSTMNAMSFWSASIIEKFALIMCNVIDIVGHKKREDKTSLVCTGFGLQGNLFKQRLIQPTNHSFVGSLVCLCLSTEH